MFERRKGMGKNDQRAMYTQDYVEKKYAEIKNMIAPRRGSQAILMDIGCGSGKDASIFAEGFGKYIGIDIDEEMLNVARANNPDDKFRFFRIDATNAKEMKAIGNATIDAILMIFVMEHISRPEYLMREVASVLKENGIICMLVPNMHSGAGFIIRLLPESIKMRLKKRITGISEEYPTYYRANTIKKLDRVTENAGLTRRDLVMYSGRGYFFNKPGFFYWHLFWSKIFSWKPLRRFKTQIIVSYQKDGKRE